MKLDMNIQNNTINSNFNKIVLTVVFTAITTFAIVLLLIDVILAEKLKVCQSGSDKGTLGLYSTSILEPPALQ